MSAQNEELRLTDEEIHQNVRVSYNPNWDEAQLFNAPLGAVAQAQLQKVYALFGGQSNFEAVLELVEQVKVPCEECGEDGVITKVCSLPDKLLDTCLCKGSGQVVQIERLVVLAEDQSLPSSEVDDFVGGLAGATYRQAQRDMLQAGFRKIAGEETYDVKR